MAEPPAAGTEEAFTRRARCRWTSDEDEALLKAVDSHGANNWDRISALVGTRKDWQCRERWHNHLKPDVKKASFSPNDDAIILNGVRTLGRRWAQIASYMPGRSPNAVKNRYHQLCRAGSGGAVAAPIKPGAPTSGIPVVATPQTGGSGQTGASVQMLVMPNATAVPGQASAINVPNQFFTAHATSSAWPIYGNPTATAQPTVAGIAGTSKTGTSAAAASATPATTAMAWPAGGIEGLPQVATMAAPAYPTAAGTAGALQAVAAQVAGTPTLVGDWPAGSQAAALACAPVYATQTAVSAQPVTGLSQVFPAQLAVTTATTTKSSEDPGIGPMSNGGGDKLVVTASAAAAQAFYDQSSGVNVENSLTALPMRG
mmetsp:Transcript_21560/g.57970  ORF Transcript_21560/g.57970 Transcript_21560/m.57970 type:complete len:372 (-) Transcript_21560:656-1771(-)